MQQNATPEPTYVNIQLPISASNPADEHVYDVVIGKKIESTVKPPEEIELSSNAAYGRGSI